MIVATRTNWDGSGLILDEAEVARRLGRSTSTLQKDRLRGSGPPYILIGRLVRYPEAWLREWLAERPRLRSTSDLGQARGRKR